MNEEKQNPNPSSYVSIPAVDPRSGDESCEDDDSSDFEFSIESPAFDLVAAGDITYPVFNRHLLDRDPTDVCSESEASVSASVSASPAADSSADTADPSIRTKKSASTGSSSASGSHSKRWSMKDIVGGRRSHSDGKEKFVFLNSKTTSSKAVKAEGDHVTANASKTAKGEMDLVTAHRIFYGAKEKKGEKKQGEKGKRSILPKPELVGLFANSRAHHHHPFNL